MNADEVQSMFAGISEITVNYAGSGDSGSIDTVEAFDSNGDVVRLTAQQKDAVEERCYELLNELPDWVNNEGGFGDASFDISRDRIEFHHSTNTTNGDQEESHHTREALPDDLRLELTRLPPSTTRIIYENGYDHRIAVCLDVDGRRVPYPDQQRLQSILDVFADNVVNQSNANRDDCQQEVDINPRTGEADVTVKWNETTSEAETHTYTFSVDDSDE